MGGQHQRKRRLRRERAQPERDEHPCVEIPSLDREFVVQPNLLAAAELADACGMTQTASRKQLGQVGCGFQLVSLLHLTSVAEVAFLGENPAAACKICKPYFKALESQRAILRS